HATATESTWEGSKQTYDITVRVEAPTGWASPANYILSGAVSWKNEQQEYAAEPETQTLTFKFKKAEYMPHLSTNDCLVFTLTDDNETNRWSNCITDYSNVFTGWVYEDYYDDQGNKRQRKVEKTWNINPPTDSYVLNIKLRYQDMK
nr:hypothetical protein [Prevotella sp.]